MFAMMNKYRKFTPLLLLVFLVVAPDVMADVPSNDIYEGVLDKYKAAVSGWSGVMIPYATWLFWTLTVISMVWTFGFMALRKAEIGEFFAEFAKFTIFTGFFFWLLKNGPAFGLAIIDSLRKIGSQAAGQGQDLRPSGVVDVGFDIFFGTVDKISITSPVVSTLGCALGLFILVVLALVAVNMLLLLVSSWVLLYGGVFFLGFGGSRWTSDIAINYYKTCLSTGASLLGMTLIIGIGVSILDEFESKRGDAIVIKELAVVLIVCVIILALVKSVPALISGIITGSSVGQVGGGGFGAGAIAGAAAMAAAGVALGASMAASGAANAAGGMQALMAAVNGGAGAGASGGGAGSVAGLGGGGSVGAGDMGSAMGFDSGATPSGGSSSGGNQGGESSGRTSGGESSGSTSNSGGDTPGGSQGGSSGATGSGAEGSSGGQGGGEPAGGPTSDNGNASGESGGSSSSGSSDANKASSGGDGSSTGGAKPANAASRVGSALKQMAQGKAGQIAEAAKARIADTAGGKLAAELRNPGAAAKGRAEDALMAQAKEITDKQERSEAVSRAEAIVNPSSSGSQPNYAEEIAEFTGDSVSGSDEKTA